MKPKILSLASSVALYSCECVRQPEDALLLSSQIYLFIVYTTLHSWVSWPTVSMVTMDTV